MCIACGESNTPRHAMHEITGSSADRVAEVATVISRHTTLPTPLADARFREEQIGDGSLGPSDFREFYFIEVESQDVSQWTRRLTPLGKPAEYTEPTEPRDWWVDRTTFDSLQFYKPDILTGRTHGWIGVAQRTGHIYMFTFTM
jgi:hypothetical protein